MLFVDQKGAPFAEFFFSTKDIYLLIFHWLEGAPLPQANFSTSVTLVQTKRRFSDGCEYPSLRGIRLFSSSVLQNVVCGRGTSSTGQSDRIQRGALLLVLKLNIFYCSGIMSVLLLKLFQHKTLFLVFGMEEALCQINDRQKRLLCATTLERDGKLLCRAWC
jgi:hypothetical protein